MRTLRNLLIGTNYGTIGIRSGRVFVAGLLTHGQSLVASVRSLVSQVVGVRAPAFALACMRGATAQPRHDAPTTQALGLWGAKRSWRPTAGSARSADKS
jgi:hypothetical protein